MNKTTIVENQTKDNSTGKPSKRIREDKPRKKDEKSVDHVLKALDSLGTTEEKLGAMCQKYTEMFNDHRVLQTAVKQAEKKNTLLQKEKEQLQAEHSKAILTRSRLENLCRELQRQNKAVKEECMLKMREEGEKKREVAAKFHSMLSEIGSLLAQNNDKNAKLRDDNLDMSMRLKSVCDQFEKKEQHVENLAKQMQLEMQLADAKLAKARMEMDIEKETLQKEKQQLLIELADYKRKLCEMKASELALREQITMYSEKYEEFHKALLQSNSAIGEFKAEMERMTKHIRRLEKETATWKSRYDAAQRTLTEVTQGKIRSDEALGLAQRRLTALQGICRGLQNQCRQLRGETRRDSQTDEEYKRLEAQIKEVERADDLDTRPCPRKISSETETPVEATAPNEVTVQDNLEPTKIRNIHNCDEAEKSEHSVEDSNVVEEKPVTDDRINVVVEKTEASNNAVIVTEGDDIKKDVNGLDQIPIPEVPCTENNNAPRDEECSVISQPSNVDENKGNQDNCLSHTAPMIEEESRQSIEDCINSLVNHIQEVSLLEGNICDEMKAPTDNRLIDEPERLSNVNDNVPNSVVEFIHKPTDSITNSPEIVQINSDDSISSINALSNNSVISCDILKDSEPLAKSECDRTTGEEQLSLIQDVNKVTSSPEDASQTKNKKKRKSKK